MGSIHLKARSSLDYNHGSNLDTERLNLFMRYQEELSNR